MKTIAVALVVCCTRAHAEKVMFRDELTGCEMWRMSDYSTFHEYCHAAKPFSYDGRQIVCRQWRADGGIVVFDLADGSEIVFGTEHDGWKENPAFVRDGNAVIYIVGRQDAPIYLYDVDTGKERRVAKLKGNVQMPSAGVIGPRSEFIMLRGDLNGDGLSDWSLKPVRSDGPPLEIWTSPDSNGSPQTVSPSPGCNRLTFSVQTCHPEVLRRLHNGQELTRAEKLKDASYHACIAVLDVETRTVQTHVAKNAKIWAHEAWSGDGEYIHMAGYSWRAGTDAPSVPIRIGDSQPSNHYGTCGHSGRYVVGDSSLDGMERLELTDLWTGEMRTVAYISTPTEPAGKIGQDHGHPAGSPDGTKVLFHSCYDLVNHRLYAVPTQDIHAGDPVIPVETTEGFAPEGRLLIGHGYVGERTVVSYQSTDATHFYGCDWGPEAAERLNRAIKSNVIRNGSHHITDAFGRLFPDGACRPRKEYIAVVKRPDPPLALAPSHTGEGVRLSWNPPASHKEVAGYVVWRRSGEGPLERLTADPIASCDYVDANPPRQEKLEYTVQAVEHSGLYGAHSSVAWVGESQAGVALVDSYDIRGCAYVTPGDRPTDDRRRVRFSIPAEGQYVLWARSRACRGAEKLRVRVDGERLPDATIEGLDWCWAKLASCRLSADEHVVELAREETYDVKEGNLLKNPSFEDGLEGWTCDEGVTSVDDTRARSGDRCVKLSGRLTRKKLFQSIDLEVKPEWSYRLSLWIRGKFTQSEAKRYNGPHPNTLGRIAMLLEPFPYPRDWYRNGNQFDDERWHEIEIVFDSPRQEPGASPAQSITAQPFWCPHFWGKQVGTVWIDDVTVTELGPRLRPVKATKLLVTNVAGYVPKGLDGRENHLLPRAPLITVSGLHQTGRTEDSVALAWNAGRAGTRAYNVYLNAGPDCPTTKYHRYTSVWSGTTVTVDGLSPATDYAVKVTAVNEDGVEGPAASPQEPGSIERPHSRLADADPLPALMPRDKTGHQFVLYADCCSGIQGGAYGANLRRVNEIVARLRPAPGFIAFPGDAVSGFTTDYDALRGQWEYWYGTEMEWLEGTGIPLFQSTSNHNTYDPGSEEVFREVHRHVPQNGPADQKGLAYYVRRGDLLYVSTHQPDRRWPQAPPSYRPDMVFDAAWLDRVLTEHKDAKFKFVAGHYPVFPVNGYVESPLWCFKPEERAPFWNVLVRHKVDAYLASHIIAFDVQIHEGVLQIVSGGAGTVYGPGGAMPGLTEYLHVVQLAIDDQTLRYQVLDVTGTVREQLSWPFSLPLSSKWQPMAARDDTSHLQSDEQVSEVVAWRFRGIPGNATRDAAPQTLLCGWRPEQETADVWVGVEGDPVRLTVRLLTGSELGVQTWEGASFKSAAEFDFQLALHPGMGPGGILYRRDDSAPWSSLRSTSPKGAEDLTWPCKWAMGMRYGNSSDQPFLGEGLQIMRTRVAIQEVW